MKGTGFLNPGHQMLPHQILGSAVLHSLKGKHPLKSYFAHVRKRLREPFHKKHWHPTHKKLTQSVLKGFIKQHENSKVHIKGVLGADWKNKSQNILKMINHHIDTHKRRKNSRKRDKISELFGKGQTGGNIFKSIGKIGKEGLHRFKRFVNGKQKFKPSALLNIVSKSTKIAGDIISVIPDPRAKAVSVGLKMASKATDIGSSALKTTGRGKGKGLKLSGQGQKAGGLTPAGGAMPFGIQMVGGKIKKNRYSVFHGYHAKTSSGLTKDAFMLKGKKVISKKRHEAGKRLQARRRTA